MYEPDWESAFWGENYSRLLEIKRKYDPDQLLDCWHCGEFASQILWPSQC